MGRVAPFLKYIGFAIVLLVLGCEAGDSVSTDGGTTVVLKPPTSNVVCDPLGGGNAQANNGLIGDLYYLSDDQPRYGSAFDYSTYGHPIDVSLYLSMLDVPTRPFDRGFFTQNGELLTNSNGNTLYEYFGIHAESSFVLGENEVEGDYQFALLADDGAVLQVNQNGAGFSNVVNNDGVHPTKLKCATTPVHLAPGQPVPMKIDYYQGPKFHVALTMMKRLWGTGGPVNDPQCNTQGNSLFWDSTQNPPAPQPAYNGLLTRGWQVVNADNFQLPTAAPNPCADAPEITFFRVDNITNSSAILYWETNVPTTSQVAFTLNAANGYTFSAEDGNLVTSHAVMIDTLQPFGLYSAYALSKDSMGRQALSSTINFRTLR